MPQPNNLQRMNSRPACGLSDFIHASALEASVGDLLEIDRTLYAHWVIFVGNGNVIHVTGVDDEDIPTDIAIVKMARLADVANGSGVRVNNKIVPAKERGLTPLPPDQVVQNAQALLGKEVPYNLLTCNCEHYVTEWKYGQGWSDQASVALSVMKTLTREHNSGHNFLLNSLNAVLNTPGSPLAKSPNRTASPVPRSPATP